MTQPTKLAVGIPAYGDALTAHHARMWMEFGNTIGNNHERWRLSMFSTVDVNPIDKARNMLLAQAILTESDWLLMIDADTWIEGYGDEDAGFQILRMIADAQRKGAAIVCAPVCPRASEKGDPRVMVYRTVSRTLLVDSDPPPEPYSVTLEMLCMNELDGRALVEIDACATACIAINVRLAAAYNAHFKFNEPLSEDLDFCRQVKIAGGKIFCDPRVLTGHKSRPMALYNSGEKS